MASISKVSGKSYRICTDAENDAYDELSFKTDAGDVSFTDGTDVETNLSAIKGITSDMSCEDENIAISAKAVNDSLETMSQNFQAGVDTLYDKCVALGSTPTDKTPSAIADAMDGLMKFAEGTLAPATYNVWYDVNLGFKPKFLTVVFYWNDSGTMRVSHSQSCSPVLNALDGRYVQITETGFKYLTNEATVVNAKNVKYAAAG